LGPRDLAPLRRLASARAPGCGPASGTMSLVMAGILLVRFEVWPRDA
jgi:hypothetical protein